MLRTEIQVQKAFDGAVAPRIASVTYNRSTRTACGYLLARDRIGAAPIRTHFVALPDGSVRLDPTDALRGSALQQLSTLKKHADYLALVYERCKQT